MRERDELQRRLKEVETQRDDAMRREGIHQRVGYEAQRRLDEILDMIDGREDIEDGEGGSQRPNIFMRIAMTARGEDRP